MSGLKDGSEEFGMLGPAGEELVDWRSVEVTGGLDSLCSGDSTSLLGGTASACVSRN